MGGLLKRSNGVPDPAEANTFKIPHVHSGKVGDALGDEGESAAGVVGAAEGEGFGGGFFPEGAVDRAALGGEADEAPAGVVFDDDDGVAFFHETMGMSFGDLGGSQLAGGFDAFGEGATLFGEGAKIALDLNAMPEGV